MMGGCLWLKRYLGTDGTESVPKMNGGKFEISTDMCGFVWLWMNERVRDARIKKLLSILSAEMMCHLHSSSFFCDL